MLGDRLKLKLNDAPNAPTGVTGVTTGATSGTLSWNAATDPNNDPHTV